MGGAAKTIGNAVGTVGTLGLNQFGPTKSLFGPMGNVMGTIATGGASGQYKNLFGAGGGGSSATQASQMSPMQVMMETGGAPLLADIAMGADPNQSLMSFFGASGDYNTWLSTLDPESQNAVKGLSTQLNSISQNTQMKTQAVQKLVNDFPDFMASAIPKYKGIADQATQAAAEQALQQTASKYAAGGQLSSGATAAALARTAAGTAEQNLQFGAGLAGQDWMNQFNQSNALLNFQQKMLGQGATAGQSAIQQMWGLNTKAGIANAEAQNKQNLANQQSQNAMWGALGTLGGTALGYGLMGPLGGAAGGQMGGALTGGGGTGMFGSPSNAPSFSGNPRLNLNPMGGNQ